MNIKQGKCRVQPIGGGPEQIVNLGRPEREKDTVLVADDVPHTETQVVPTMTVRMTGIVSLKPWTEPPLMVNDIDIIRVLDAELRKCGVKPVRNNSDCFAGQVVVTIRLMGDLEEKDNDKI